MATTTKKRGGRKRLRAKTSPLAAYAVPQWLPALGQIELTPPQPQKSLGDLLSELVWEIAKAAWKQTDPASYQFNQAMFELAPYCPPENRWLLGIGAVGSAVYGMGKVADRLEREAKRG
jgi:hypothetical protein